METSVNAAIVPTPNSTIGVAGQWAGFGLGLWDAIRTREAADDLANNQERDFDRQGENARFATDQAAGINARTLFANTSPASIAIAGGLAIGAALLLVKLAKA